MEMYSEGKFYMQIKIIIFEMQIFICLNIWLNKKGSQHHTENTALWLFFIIDVHCALKKNWSLLWHKLLLIFLGKKEQVIKDDKRCS